MSSLNKETGNTDDVREGELLWTPSQDFIDKANITAFLGWLEERKGLTFQDYNSLWRWSVDNLEEFWRAAWDYFQIVSDAPIQSVVSGDTMLDARWFAGSETNYAEHLLRHESRADSDEAAIVHLTERSPVRSISWTELGNSVRAVAQSLRDMGIKKGDYVVSYMPNVPETAIAMMATAAIGAVWSSASPDFGARTVVERFSQISPKLAFFTDGYVFGGQQFDRREEVAKIVQGLPSLSHVVWLPHLGLEERPDVGLPAVQFDSLLSRDTIPPDRFEYARVAHDHPLWVLFSSGTTGVPKAIVHGHPGMIAEHLKVMTFHCNLSPGKRMFFYTTTGWMMWNSVISALICGATSILYDGSPVAKGVDTLWQIAEQTGATFFGASPTLVQTMKREGIRPKDEYDLTALESIIVGGAPSTPEIFKWFFDDVREDLWLTSQSGGTEICSGLAVGMPILPVHAGEIQCRALGIDVAVWNDEGEPVTDETGELVVTQPMPSAPLFFAGDPDKARYKESYYSTFPGIWRHGDLAKLSPRGGLYIYGRSDSTLNRYGVRIGSGEIYRVMEQIDGILDSLVVCCELPGGEYYMPMFVSLKPGVSLTDQMLADIRRRLREDASPRHVPDEIFATPGIPYTITGKKMEIPIRKLIMGFPTEKAVSRDAMGRPELLDWYLEFSARPEIVAKRQT